jgi:hypothetical protein
MTASVVPSSQIKKQNKIISSKSFTKISQMSASAPYYGRIEGAARQRRRASLLLAHPDFQTLRHSCVKLNWKNI